MKPYTRFRATCFQDGHPDNIRLFTFINQYYQALKKRGIRPDGKPGIHPDDCKEGDVVILIYPHIQMYAERFAHASICFFKDLNKEWQEMYLEDTSYIIEQEHFIYVHEFQSPEQHIDLFSYDPDKVRGVNHELMPLVQLLENPNIISMNKTASILPIPKTSL